MIYESLPSFQGVATRLYFQVFERGLSMEIDVNVYPFVFLFCNFFGGEFK